MTMKYPLLKQLMLLFILPAVTLGTGRAGDDFDRSDGDLGQGWKVPEGMFSIAVGEVLNGPSGFGPFTPGVAVFADSAGIAAFTASVVVGVHVESEAALTGLAFRVQENGDGYAFRISPAGYAQFVMMAGGEALEMAKIELDTELVVGGRYRLDVKVEHDSGFSGSVTDMTSGTVVGTMDGVTDNGGHYETGACGLYARHGKQTFDDFTFDANPH